MKSYRILVVWNGPDSGTSANLFKALCLILRQNHSVTTSPNGIISGSRFRKIIHLLGCEIRRWPKIIRSDALVFHSYIALSFPSVLLARLLHKRIILVLWDTYPITVDGQVIGGKFRVIFDRMECIAIRLATRVVIPTADFLPFVNHSNIRTMPLWPSLPIGTVRIGGEREPQSPIRLAFVGQIALTRGLPDALQCLSREVRSSFELHIFSPKPPDVEWAEIAPNVKIVARGYLPRKALLESLEQLDFGLISLHPKMGQPGFPSKVFDYIAVGLPVVYTGRPLPAFEHLLKVTGVGICLGAKPIDWEAELTRTSEHMPQAVKLFLKETELTANKINRTFFE